MKISTRKLNRFLLRTKARFTGRQVVHLLHIRKAAGTALKAIFEESPQTPTHVVFTHPHRISFADIPKGEKVVILTRDPVTRFVSGFQSRLNQGYPAHSVKWNTEEEKAFSHFKSAESLALALDPGHERYTEATHAMKHIRHLSCQYWDWLCSEELLKERADDIFAVGRVENMDDFFSDLKARLNLPANLELPRGAKAANKSAKKETLSDAAKANVEKWYQEDYKARAAAEESFAAAEPTPGRDG